MLNKHDGKARKYCKTTDVNPSELVWWDYGTVNPGEFIYWNYDIIDVNHGELI